MERAFLENDDLLKEVLGDIADMHVLDIGAGTGRLTQELSALGARTVGVEPNGDLVALAQGRGIDAQFVVAPAEATTLEADSFDVSIFSLSLHHASDMQAAVGEACRVTRAGGRIVVIEPEAPDPIFPVVRFIDDESAVYAQAQHALEKAIAAGLLEQRRTLHFASKYRVETPNDMIVDLTSIDSGRELKQADRPAFEAAFQTAYRHDETGGYLPYWSRADVFRRP